MDDKRPILDYLNGKNNEAEVISLLREQKKGWADPANMTSALEDEYFSLIVRLIGKSSGKVKYHALILISNVGFCVDARKFREMCRIAVENSDDKDGNIRHACVILIKHLDLILKVLPLRYSVGKTTMSDEDINIFYESFRGLFYGLCDLLKNDDKEEGATKSVSRSINVMAPKIYDMASFCNDKKEMDMVMKLQQEIRRVL